MNTERHTPPIETKPHQRGQNAIRDTALRSQLIDRRQRLKDAVSGSPDTESLVQLLQEVDTALERMEYGTFGLCETCHDPIEHDRLLVNPLIRYCLDHLSEAEQRALERDIDLAARIQGGLLPTRDLHVDGWRVAYHYEPAGPVSGDYCDLIVPERKSDSFFFLVGDVTGKGVAASLLMAHLHAIFRSLTTTTLQVHELVEKANRVFCEGTLSTHFATLICGLATNDGTVEICNAGHCLPLLSQGGTIKSIPSTGLPLGLFCDSRYTSAHIALRPGDSLFLYTDGITEARNEVSMQYGERRLEGFLRNHPALSPDELIRASLDELASFRSGSPKWDDMTLMVVRRS